MPSPPDWYSQRKDEGMSSMGEITPSVYICLSQSFNDALVEREVLRGLEEESVPWEIVHLENNDRIALAYEGALRSALEVGIGIDSNGFIAVHYRKLPPSHPLFEVNYINNFNEVKDICANAARLIKNTPLRVGGH